MTDAIHEFLRVFVMLDIAAAQLQRAFYFALPFGITAAAFMLMLEVVRERDHRKR